MAYFKSVPYFVGKEKMEEIKKRQKECGCRRCAFGYPVGHYCPRDFKVHPCEKCKDTIV